MNCFAKYFHSELQEYQILTCFQEIMLKIINLHSLRIWDQTKVCKIFTQRVIKFLEANQVHNGSSKYLICNLRVRYSLGHVIAYEEESGSEAYL